MKNFIAERELFYSLKGESARKKIFVRIGAPCLVKEGEVSFEFSPGTSVCKIQIDGLPEDFTETVYGADSIQALALAADIDPYLKRLEKKYDLFFVSGEPYFDE